MSELPNPDRRPISAATAKQINSFYDEMLTRAQRLMTVAVPDCSSDPRSMAVVRTKIDEARMWTFEALRQGKDITPS